MFPTVTSLFLEIPAEGLADHMNMEPRDSANSVTWVPPTEMLIALSGVQPGPWGSGSSLHILTWWSKPRLVPLSGEQCARSGWPFSSGWKCGPTLAPVLSSVCSSADNELLKEETEQCFQQMPGSVF